MAIPGFLTLDEIFNQPVSFVKNDTLFQGPKLTFFGRRQLATEIFFSVAI